MTSPVSDNQPARKTARRQILARAKELQASREISPTEYLLLSEIMLLTDGRLQACLCSYQFLAKKLGRTRNHIQKLIRHLEELGLVKRHYRYRANTKHHLTNVIEVVGYTRVLKFEWKRALGDGAGVAALPPLTLEELIDGLRNALAAVKKYDFGTAQSLIKSWWNAAREAEPIKKFLSYFQRQQEDCNRKILHLSAYINACLNRFMPSNCFFFEVCLDYLNRLQQSQQAQVAEPPPPPLSIAQQIAQDKAQKAQELRERIEALEKALGSIPISLSIILQERMRSKHTRDLQALKAELEELEKS